jgi:hypothetical protein
MMRENPSMRRSQGRKFHVEGIPVTNSIKLGLIR